MQVYRAFVASRAVGGFVVGAVLLGLEVNPVRTAKLARLDLKASRAEQETQAHQATRDQSVNPATMACQEGASKFKYLL